MGKLHERLRAAIPTKEETPTFVVSFLIALVAKVPLSAVNTAGTIVVLEKMREDPNIVPWALLAYTLYNFGSAGPSLVTRESS